MTHGARETEIKLASPDLKLARRRLHAAGFRISKPRVFERNTIFGKGRRNPQAATVLRVREAGRTVKVTYKGRIFAGRHKSREELELEISDAGAMARIFERLGFRSTFRYEKYRTEFKHPQGGDSGGVATLDETPIGVYMELEGTARWIDRTAGQLGFQKSDYVTASYGQLYLEWCKQRRVKPTNMVFA